MAEEGMVIKLVSGVYNCQGIKITYANFHDHLSTPGLKIEPRDKDKLTYLLGHNGPVIRVDLKDK